MILSALSRFSRKGSSGMSPGRASPDKTAEDGPQEPDQSLGPLQVAPQPQEVVGHPAGQIAAAPELGDRLESAHQAEGFHRLVGQHPDVLALLLLRTYLPVRVSTSAAVMARPPGMTVNPCSVAQAKTRNSV